MHIKRRTREQVRAEAIRGRLTAEAFDEADEAAYRRTYGTPHVTDYIGDGRDLAREQCSCRGERICKTFLDPTTWVAWRPFADPNVPEIGGFVDAKTKNQIYEPEDAWLLVSALQPPKPDWAYVCVTPTSDPFELWIVGWQWGRAVLTAPTRFHGRRKAYCMPATILLRPGLLRAVLHGSEAAPSP